MGESNRRIVFLGKTGVGKSSVANTIFGEELFKAVSSANSVTSKCQAETRPVSGRSLTLIDSPGLFDTVKSEKELKPEIIKCIIECASGPHAFLIVFKVDRFTEQEEAVVKKISQYFSEEVFKYATVLFTHGDQLKEEQTIEDFIQQNQLAGNLVKKCGGRCHVIDNKYWKNNQQDEYRSNQFQVKELLKTMDEMVEANKGSCYTNEMLQAVEKQIQEEEEELIRQSSGNMSQEEVREQAKDGVFKRLEINLAGIRTGVLLGALFGVTKMVGKVLLVLTVGAAAAVVAVGTAAVAVGGAAAGAVALAGVVVGAVKGGVAGYRAAEGADSPEEAEQRATKAVMDE